MKSDAGQKLTVLSSALRLLGSELCDPDLRPDTAEGFFDMYHSVLQSLADRFAPVRKLKLRRQRLAPWMDDECRRQRRQSRRLERCYRRTQSIADRQAWVAQERRRHHVYRQKERAYWSAEVMMQTGQPKNLWRTMNCILGRKRSSKLPRNSPSAQQFLDLFNEKVAAVHRSTAGGTAQSTLPDARVTFDTFDYCTEDDVQRAITGAASKSCALDPLPTTVLKEFLPELLPFLTDLCNSSLLQGSLPLSQRQAIVFPRLKKVGADPADGSNYRPVSNLTFMSKIVERLVCRQLTTFLDRHKLLPDLQSAYRKQHSTETAVLKIISDILQAADKGKVTLLGLLDMSAAFDTVDHAILISRLEVSFGLRGTVLSWIQSFITGRTQAVHVGDDRSTVSDVLCGVPQGSVLGPVLFLLYTADVLNIVRNHRLMGHSYADDTSIYLHADACSCAAQLLTVIACIDDICSWMSSNRLKLNMDKTQFIWLGTAQQLEKVNIQTVTLADVDIHVSDTVTCLGVVIDSTLTFAENVKKRAGNCFYQLRQLRTVRRTLSIDAAKTLVHSVISNRVDYCNSLLYGMSAVHLRPLQSVLNASARLITGKRKYDHITDTMRDDLHWLPVRQRIEYKLCTLVSKCLRRTAPPYLADMCVPVSATVGRLHLRSAARHDLTVPRTRLVRYGQRSFAVSGPTTWNTLPQSIRNLSCSFVTFGKKLKTELFHRAYGTSIALS